MESPNPNNMYDIQTIAHHLDKDAEVIYLGYIGEPDETEWQKEHEDWLNKVSCTEVGWYIVNRPKNVFMPVSEIGDYEFIQNPYYNLTTIGSILKDLGHPYMSTDLDIAYEGMMKLLNNKKEGVPGVLPKKTSSD